MCPPRRKIRRFEPKLQALYPLGAILYPTETRSQSVVLPCCQGGTKGSEKAGKLLMRSVPDRKMAIVCFLRFTGISTRATVSGRFWNLEAGSSTLEEQHLVPMEASSVSLSRCRNGRKSGEHSDSLLEKWKWLNRIELARVLLEAFSPLEFGASAPAEEARKTSATEMQVRGDAGFIAVLFAAYVATLPPVTRRERASHCCRCARTRHSPGSPSAEHMTTPGPGPLGCF
jgi:hypothetical protein